MVGKPNFVPNPMAEPATIQQTLRQTMQRWRRRVAALPPDVSSTPVETPGSQAPDKTIRDVSVPTPAGKDPRRMYIPDEIMAGYSPLQKQYWGALLEEKGEDVSVGKLVASLLLPIVLELVHGIKSQNADLVLFVRVGGFYELFGDDADIGAMVGLKLMGGARLSTEALGRLQSTSAPANKSDWSLMHRAGCRAQSFLFWASKVLALGFCVGRVEEVEVTPNADSRPEGTDGYRGLEGKLTDMRDKNMDAKEKKERKPKTKHRALVQVYSPGTFGLWCEAFDEGMEESRTSSTAAFVALCEDEQTSGLLGSCCVDTVRGALYVGAWQEADAERSVLVGMVEAYGVGEVVVGDVGLFSADTRRAIENLKVSSDAGMEVQCGVRHVRQYDLRDPDAGFYQEAASRVAAAEASGCDVFGGSLSSAAQRDFGIKAVAIALRYMRDTGVIDGMASRMCVQRMDVGEVPRVGSPEAALPTTMVLNGSSLRNLEIFQGASLHLFLSGYASTPMGSRTIRRWLARPLMQVQDIEQRLDVVDAFRSSGEADCRILREGLLKLRDVEKKMPMVAHQLSTLPLEDANESLMMLLQPVDPSRANQEKIITWGQVKNLSLVVNDLLYFAKEYMQWYRTAPAMTASSPILHGIHEIAVAAHDICLPIVGSIPLPSAKAGAADSDSVLLPSGVWPSIDQHRAGVESCKAELAAHEQRLVDLIIKSCHDCGEGNTRKAAATLRKIRILGVDDAIGIICPKSLEAVMARAFPHWDPTERSRSGIMYKESQLTALAVELAKAQRAYNLAANQAMGVLFNLFLDEYGTLLRFCQSIGELDGLLAFAKLADDGHGERRLSRPRFDCPVRTPSAAATHPTRETYPGYTSEMSIDATPTTPILFLRDAWNPQLLTHTKASDIVPNTISIGGTSPSALLISGANSGGKTNVLKAAAIATIMAQAGSYVPCSDSVITPVSRILTRLGARDRLSAGESTFAIEMKETSAILGQADAHSLAVIDELGRGTSPSSGMAIAWATLNSLASHCRSMLATHYHEMNEDFEFDPRVARFHVPVAEKGAGRFGLRTGPEPHLSSGGVVCAKNAGVCIEVLQCAERISNRVKNQLRDARPSRERRLALAVIEMLRATPLSANTRVTPICSAPSLQSLQRMQLQVAFLLEDD